MGYLFGTTFSGLDDQSQIQSVDFPGGSMSLTSWYLTWSKFDSNSTCGLWTLTGLNKRS